jgi:guanosine-3',5'-bis(diphosphate) 3'-pyrophosphohydrolase
MSVNSVTLKETNLAIEEVVEIVRQHFPSVNLDPIRRAYAFAEEQYADLVHPTDKTYIQFTCSVAKYLAETGSEPCVVAASIICPPPVEGKVLDLLKKKFRGENELLELVEEVLDINNLEWRTWLSAKAHHEFKERGDILQKMFLLAVDESKSEDQEQNLLAAVHFQKKERQIENLIRMFLAAATDIRALVIKLVERLYFIKFIKDLSPSRQQTMNYKLLAKITLEIYAPIADRLGMWHLKSRLEDMSFRLLEMDKYLVIAKELAAKKQERDEYIANTIIPTLKKKLKEYGIEAEIFGRAKHIYSIYKKMEAAQLTFEEIEDLLGIRIIVDSNDNCYNAQSILHECWSPLSYIYDGKAGRDWIANPKENLYQSLHTTILFEGRPVEVQIRTTIMHKIAEYGVTVLRDVVHWRYKDSKTYRKAKIPRIANEKQRNKQLAELRKILSGEQEVIISMVKDLLEDKIFVITPQGHVIDLPAHATPLDFAYRIHSDFGNRYSGAKVGNHLVRLDYELKNGEIVELLTSRAGKGPSPEWLSMSKDENDKRYYVFARTSKARTQIRKSLREQKLI